MLLVEDEPPVRTLIRRVLARQGYTILEAGDGEAGLRLWQEHRADVALVITDTVMPLMGGREMVRRIREVQPDLPVLFMSGYSPDHPAMGAPADERSEFIAKPFEVDDFARTARRALEKGDCRAMPARTAL